MSIWKAIWRIIRYRPGLYALTAINWGLIRLLPLLPGLITREIFNLLAGEATPEGLAEKLQACEDPTQPAEARLGKG